MKILDEAAVKSKRQSLLTIDLRRESNLRHSWRSAIDKVDLTKALKHDESY